MSSLTSASYRRFASRLLQLVVCPLLLGYLFVLVVWMALDASSQTAQKSYFYVSPDGSGSNAGTVTAPWKTLQRGGAGDQVAIGNITLQGCSKGVVNEKGTNITMRNLALGDGTPAASAPPAATEPEEETPPPPPAPTPVPVASSASCTAPTSTLISGTSYYVSPDGGGNCSSSSPCSLDTALSKAGPSDEVVLKNGVYDKFINIKTKRSGTASAPITIRAENQHQAIIKPSNPGHRKNILRVEHDHLVIRGLVFDGSKRVHVGVSFPGKTMTTGAVFENNIIQNMGGSGLVVQSVRNVVIRHNLIAHTGYQSSDSCCGSAFYIGTPADQKYVVENLQIYGNTIHDATNNAFDLKNEEVVGTSIHHNIIEGHVLPEDHGRPKGSGGGNDGLFILVGKNTDIHDNIIRNNKVVTRVFNTRDSSPNQKIAGNVIMNSTTSGVLRNSVQHFSNNTACDLSKYGGMSNSNGNRANAPMSACKSEEARILAEMKNLLGCGTQ